LRRILLKVLGWIVFAVLTVCVLVWLVLATPLFSDFRKNFVADLLTDQLGQPFLIEGDARVVLAGTTLVHVSGARIPSENIPSLNLAELDLLEWELNLPALLDGRIDIDNLTIDGLQTNLITQADGTTSWTKGNNQQAGQKDEEADQAPPEKENFNQDASPADQAKPTIISFLSDRTVSFSNIGLVSKDEASGFEFDFQLEKILLEQLEGGNLVSVTGEGSVNGERFTWDGKFPDGAAFTNLVEFGDISLSYNGARVPNSSDSYTAKLALDTGQIGDVFEALGLVRSLEGVGTVSMDVTSAPDRLALHNLQTSLTLDKGQAISITGNIDNVLSNAGFDLRIDARLHPEGQPPAAADSLKNLKLREIKAHIVNVDDKLKFEELLVLTNAFDQGLDRVGPISIGHIYRSEAKTLGLRDIALQAGPEANPYLVAEGDIGDVLNLGLVDLNGRLHGEADLLLKNLSAEEVAKFGGVEADFSISDHDGALSLRKLNARTVNTELWTLQADLVIASIEELAGLKLGFDFGVSDTAPFLAALGLDPVDVESLSTSLSLEGAAKEAKIGVGFLADETDLSTQVSFDLSQDINVVRGKIESQRMRLSDLREGAKIFVQLSERSKAQKMAAEDQEIDDGPPIQPLVLEKNDGIFDLKRILTETDLEIDLDIAEFVGDAGTSSMNSRFIAKKGQIQAGPLELYLGPGFFKVTASMDAVNDPERVRVEGATSGWDFGEILKAVGVDIQAHGLLSANVDVTGNISSGKAFANSMAGWATLNMSNGAIATSLLELAGLGIFPWLVSKEFSEGETQIVCVKAPISINAGKVSFDSVVAETASVQLVVKGAVDWVRDSIAIRAEPRRVGMPLARSAWPFDVEGKLSDPKFKLDIGGSRSRRNDGADEMPANREPCTPDFEQLQ